MQSPVLTVGANQSTANEWKAHLRLGYAQREGRTVLARRAQFGPLVVQRPFYPEGPQVCHTIIVHPPAGIAGGDRLETSVEVDPGAHVVITTPGATKWYRCAGVAGSSQATVLRVAGGACLEWLPQETIMFRGARASASLSVQLAPGGMFLGWDVSCFGRTASGERFDRGVIRQATEIMQDGRLLWGERMLLEGGSRLLDSAAGLRGCPVSAVLLAAGRDPPSRLIQASRELAVDANALCGVTVFPSLLVARYLGHSSEDAHRYLCRVWGLLRTHLIGREACPPRIWRT
jgi:urease accessory protein